MEFLKNLSDKVKKRYLAVLFLFILMGLLLRFYQIGVQSVWFDEAISGIAARGFLKNGFPVLPSGMEYNRAILHTGLVASSFGILGQTTAAGRVPAAIFGVLSIPLAYLLGGKSKNRRVGILLAFFVTFATVQIAWSRQIRMYQQLQFFFLLSLYLLERLMEKMSWKRFALLFASGFCMTVSHDSFGYLLGLPILVWFAAEKFGWLREKVTNLREIETKNWVGLASLVVVVLLILVARGLPLGSASRLMEWDVNYTVQYLFHFGAEMGPLLLLAIPGAFLGLLERRRNLLYIFSFLLPFWVVSNRVLAGQDRYVFMLFPLLFAFAALTLDYLYERLKESLPNLKRMKIPVKSVLPITIVILILVPMVSAAKFTFTPRSRYELGPTAPQGQFRPAYEYVEMNWEENDVVVSTLTPVTWYYLERSDYWISFSPWGLGELPDEDSYTGAEVIKTVEDMRRVKSDSHGWIVIDLMGVSRANENLLDYIGENFDLVWFMSGRSKGVWLYRW